MDSSPPILFNRARLRKRRERAAAHFAQHDFLWHEAASRAEETLGYIKREFATMLVFGGHGFTAPASTTRLIRAEYAALPNIALVADEEALPFAENSLDAVICLLNLHWVNDLPGTLAQIRRALKPDGLFLAILPGGETLRELRSIFAEVEAELTGGISPRIAPFIDVRDAGALLQRAGFALPVADTEMLTLSYENIFALMADLRGAGQSNMLQQQVQHFTPKHFFLECAKRYATQHSDAEGRLTATIELITLSGWKPAETQQQPARRGSGTVSLREVLD